MATPAPPAVGIEEHEFGKMPDGRKVTLCTMTNDCGVSVSILNLGCIIQSLKVKSPKGEWADVVLGCGSMEGWLKNPCYFGCVVGRYCNRLGKGVITIDGKEMHVSKNERDGLQTLHGGFEGFDKKLWDSTVCEAPDAFECRLSYVSPDGEEGFPGKLTVTVTYRLLKSKPALEFKTEATTTAPTVCSMTNHSYFNLAGHKAGCVLEHELQIAADQIAEVTETMVPTGKMIQVENTPFDFREMKKLGKDIEGEHPMLKVGAGYDHSWQLSAPATPGAAPVFCCELRDPQSGRRMKVMTTKPAVQVYTGNFIDDFKGTAKEQASYGRRTAVALETQFHPDSPNQPGFKPSSVLKPGEAYCHCTVYDFSQ